MSRSKHSEAQIIAALKPVGFLGAGSPQFESERPDHFSLIIENSPQRRTSVGVCGRSLARPYSLPSHQTLNTPDQRMFSPEGRRLSLGGKSPDAGGPLASTSM